MGENEAGAGLPAGAFPAEVSAPVGGLIVGQKVTTSWAGCWQGPMATMFKTGPLPW